MHRLWLLLHALTGWQPHPQDSDVLVRITHHAGLRTITVLDHGDKIVATTHEDPQ